MATERQTQAMLRALAAEKVPAEDAAVVELQRRRVVEATARAIARAATERQRRRRWARGAIAFASAAAIAVTAGAVWKSRSSRGFAAGASADEVARGEPLVGALHRSHAGESLPAVAGSLPLGAGDELATEPGGRGEVVLADGVAITLESETQLRLPDSPRDATAKAHEEVALASGMVSVRVPPMSAGHTFAIKTPDAKVTVHGTSFTVEVTRAAGDSPSRGEQTGLATRVRVSAGVVSVSSGGREVFLTAGMEWTSPLQVRVGGVDPPAPIASALPVPPAPPPMASGPARGATGRVAHREGPSSSATVSKSRLGEENQLLSAAIAASKTGDYAGAVVTVDDLLRRFPGSTLAQEAHVERFRALSHGSDPAAAAKEARLYLALYPDGFAREEARGLAVGW